MGVSAGRAANWFRQLSPTRRRLSLFGAVLVAACVTTSGLAVWQLAQDAQGAARSATRMLGTVIAEQMERSFQSIDLVLSDTISELLAIDGAGMESSAAAHRILVDGAKQLPQVDALIVTDPDGRVQNSSRGWLIVPTDVSTRPYFKAMRAGRVEGSLISEPMPMPSGQGMVLYVARRIEGPDRSFLGVLHASIRLQSVEDFYRRIDMADGFAVSLMRQDGLLLMRYPPVPQQLGRHVADDSPWHNAVAAGGGNFGDIEWDGVQRFNSVHRLSGFPLVVTTSVSESEAYLEWRGRLGWILLATTVAVACLLLMFSALMRAFGRQEASQAALRSSEQALAVKSDLLQTTFDHMEQGLVMVSPEGRIEVCNRRAIELLDLPEEMMRARPTFEALLQYQIHVQREFVEAGPDIPFLMFDQTQNSWAHYERVRPNGTCLEVTSVLLSGGGMVRTFLDVTARRKAERRIAYQAFHDDLTQLCNRVRVHERLNECIADARRSGMGLAVLYLDLDRFKLVNDTRGHAAGDQLLIETADRMRATLREGDTVGRLGGDEFAVVFPGIGTMEQAVRSAQRLAEAIRAPYSLGGTTGRIDVSIGIALFPEDGDTAEVLLSRADSAMYRAKDGGRGAIARYEPVAETAAMDALMLETDLRRALELDQFELAYQPIFHAASGAPLAFEALLRWRHPTRGVVPPSVFIPLAERSGVIEKLGRWVLHTACTEAATWAMPVRLSINLSPAQFHRMDLEDQVIETLHRSGLAPERLDLEITEGVLLEHTAQVLATMMSLRTLGVRLVLDDFGTANSSLSYLRDFPFQKIKIDRSFVSAMLGEPSAMTIVQMVIDMASAMRLSVVAEGVEDQAELDALRRLGCDEVQGFLLGRPQSPERTREYLWQFNRRSSGGAEVLEAS